MQRDELHVCISTLLPNPYECTPETFDDTVAACRRAGFDGISLWSLHHMTLEAAGRPAEETKNSLAAAGLTVSCIEAIFGWANAASASAAVADAEASIALCELYGARQLAAVLLDPELRDPVQAASNLAAVADRAAEVGVSICIEFLPWTGIPDLGTTWELIERSERANVGILLDSWHWHWQPGGPVGANAALLSTIPGERIGVFQLCDSVAEPAEDQLAECMSNRPLPGAGVVDHDSLFAILSDIGADPVVAPEVFNTALVAQGAAVAAEAIASASRRTLAAW